MEHRNIRYERWLTDDQIHWTDDDTWSDVSSSYAAGSTDARSERSQPGSPNLLSESHGVKSSSEVESSRYKQDHSLQYRMIVADQRSKVYSTCLDTSSDDNVAASLVPETQGSKQISGLNGLNARSTKFYPTNFSQISVDTRSGIGSTSNPHHDAPLQVAYVEPRFDSSRKIKALRFQDTADYFASPSTKLNEAELRIPLLVANDPKSASPAPRRSLSTMNSNRSRFLAKISTSRSPYEVSEMQQEGTNQTDRVGITSSRADTAPETDDESDKRLSWAFISSLSNSSALTEAFQELGCESFSRRNGKPTVYTAPIEDLKDTAERVWPESKAQHSTRHQPSLGKKTAVKMSGKRISKAFVKRR